jgi:hypothetical protein
MENLAHWLNLEAIKLLTHHTSAVVAAVLLTALVGYLVQRLLHDSFAKKCILWMDELLIVALFLWFAYELFLAL